MLFPQGITWASPRVGWATGYPLRRKANTFFFFWHFQYVQLQPNEWLLFQICKGRCYSTTLWEQVGLMLPLHVITLAMLTMAGLLLKGSSR